MTAAAAPELSGYTYIKPLGSGGFAEVFLYEQHLPRRQVAVKVMHADGLTDENRQAFVAEANIMAQLAHPYIVKIYQADVASDGRPYIVMEYCSGQNLGDRYKAKPLSVTEALRTGIRLSGAIATAHAAGVLHRDIKPQNVLTNDYGWPALTDFGISSVVDDGRAGLNTAVEGATITETAGGTSQQVGMSIPWSPPEMFDDDPRPDVRSDVFALAATVWTLLAGRTPFEVPGRSNQALDLMTRIERGAVTPMDRPDVPGTLIAVLRKGMAVDPKLRFQSAVDFARALQSVELELSYAPTPLDVPNLNVAEPLSSPDQLGADATRIRSVTSIDAQVPVAPHPPTPAVSEAPADRTTVRGARVVADSTPVVDRTVRRGATSDSVPVVETLAIESKPNRGRVGVVLGSVVGGLVIVTAAIVGVLIATSGSATQPRNNDLAVVDSGDQLPVVADAVPTPVLISAAPEPTDATSIVFEWSNPGGEPDDTFVWQRTDGAGDGTKNPTAGHTATIDGVSAGTTVCLEVFVLRGGELSPEPLKACYP